MSYRWHFFDPATDEAWDITINPNQMSSPFEQKNVETLWEATRTAGRTAREWTFGGIIRGKAMYDELVRWFDKPGLIQLRDHFQRTWEVMLVELDEKELRPGATESWKFTYTARVYVTRRVS